MFNEFGLPGVIDGIQDLVGNAFAAEQAGEGFRGFHTGGAHQHRLTGGLTGFDCFHGGGELGAAGGEDEGIPVLPPQGPVGRDDRDVHAVDIVELGGLGFGGAGHAGEAAVEAEEILQGDGGEGVVFILDAQAFLGFHGLVQPVAPPAAGHLAAGVFIHDDHAAVLNDIIHIPFIGGMGPEQLQGVMLLEIFGLHQPHQLGELTGVGAVLRLVPRCVFQRAGQFCQTGS